MKTDSIFTTVWNFIVYVFQLFAHNSIIIDLVNGVLYFAAVALFIILNVLILTWMDRRIAGFFQERLGPNRNGPFGLLQSIYDTVKLIGKGAIIPRKVDKLVYNLAPMLIFMTTVLLYAVLPYGKKLTIVNINVGVLYFIAISSTTTIAILMSGWGSNNKYSLLGGMRTVAQIISYEIPFAFSILGIVMISGSMNLTDIVQAQKGIWFILIQPLAFVIFIITALAELNKSPFDFPEAEQELTAGFYTEYSGMRFALIFLAEYANIFSMAAIGATLFLGGWQGPLLPSWLWFLLKVYLMIFVIMWIRWTMPRIRLDRMMKLNWKVLIPLSILNIFLTGIGIKLYQYFTGTGGV